MLTYRRITYRGRKDNMKVIGKTTDGCIINISNADLKKLTGFYNSNHSFMMGDTLEVAKLYHQLKELGNQEKTIKKIVHTLRTAAGMLEKINPIFHEEEK